MVLCVLVFEPSGSICMQVWRHAAFGGSSKRREFLNECITMVLKVAGSPPIHISGTLCHSDVKAVYKSYDSLYFMAVTETSVADWVTMRLLETYYNSLVEAMGKPKSLMLKTNFDKAFSILDGCLLKPFAKSSSVKSEGDVSMCRVAMNNINGSVTVGEKVSYAVSTVGAGPGVVSAEVQEEGRDKPLSPRVQQLTETMYKVTYKPAHKGEYAMRITFDEEEIDGSPFTFTCVDKVPEAVHCKAEGKGLYEAKQGKEESVRIAAPNQSADKLTVSIDRVDPPSDPDAADITIQSSKEEDNSYTVSYTIPQPGEYQMAVHWDTVDIPGSPFKIKCHPLADPQKFFLAANGPVKVDDVFTGHIQRREGADPTAEVMAVIIGPKQTVVSRSVVESENEKISRNLSFTPTESGKYLINVYADGNHIDGSPFKLKTFSPERVCARGPGLLDGFVGQKGTFSIETSKAGEGNLVVMVHGPRGGFKLNMSQDRKMKRTVLASYQPSYPGSYLVDVMWSGWHVPGSPFKVKIADNPPVSPHLRADVGLNHD